MFKPCKENGQSRFLSIIFPKEKIFYAKIRKIFDCSCNIDKVQLLKLTNQKQNSNGVCQATFQVDVLLDSSAILNYFKER